MNNQTETAQQLKATLDVMVEEFLAGNASFVRRVCDRLPAPVGDALYEAAEELYRARAGLV